LICDYDSARRLIDDDENYERITTGRSSRPSRVKKNTTKQLKAMSLVETGSKNVMLLQMNIERVLDIMRDDDGFSRCMKRLIFLGLQERIISMKPQK
jgi:hypothetical protein